MSNKVDTVSVSHFTHRHVLLLRCDVVDAVDEASDGPLERCEIFRLSIVFGFALAARSDDNCGNAL